MHMLPQPSGLPQFRTDRATLLAQHHSFHQAYFQSAPGPKILRSHCPLRLPIAMTMHVCLSRLLVPSRFDRCTSLLELETALRQSEGNAARTDRPQGKCSQIWCSCAALVKMLQRPILMLLVRFWLVCSLASIHFFFCPSTSFVDLQ